MTAQATEPTVAELLDGLTNRADPLTQYAGRKLKEAWAAQEKECERLRADADNWRRQALAEDERANERMRYLREAAMHTLDGILLEPVSDDDPVRLRNYLFAACRRRWLEMV